MEYLTINAQISLFINHINLVPLGLLGQFWRLGLVKRNYLKAPLMGSLFALMIFGPFPPPKKKKQQQQQQNSLIGIGSGLSKRRRQHLVGLKFIQSITRPGVVLEKT